MLKTTCADMDGQMAERTKTRQLEIEATSKALAVLSGDEAHDTFTSTFNAAAFLQERSSRSANADRRAQAAKVLLVAAKKLGSPKLATLATSVRLDDFKQLKKAIDKMVGDLKAEKQSEIEHRDWCIEEFSNTEKATELHQKDLDATNAKIEGLTNTIEVLTSAIDTLTNET